jgi:hypothetical protein
VCTALKGICDIKDIYDNDNAGDIKDIYDSKNHLHIDDF